MAVVLFASKPSGGGFSQVFAQHPLANNNGEIVLPNGNAAGQTFPGSGQALTALRVATRKAVGASGNLTASVYATSGGVPTGAALASSTAVNTSALGTTMNGQKFTFGSPATLAPGVTYGALVAYAGTGEVAIGVDTSAGYASGQAATYDGSFAVVPGSDVGFQAITTDTEVILPTTWNSADKSATIVLSGSDRIASENDSAIAGVRSVSSKATGKFYVEITNSSPLATSGDWACGFINAAAGLDTTFVAANQRLIYRDTGGTFLDGVAGASAVACGFGSTVQFAINVGTRAVWARVDGGAWVGGGDPVAGTSPLLTIGDTDALFIAARTNNQVQETSYTLNLAPWNWLDAPPAGYGVWSA